MVYMCGCTFLLQSEIRGLANQLIDMEDDLEHKPPSARDRDGIHAQIDDIKVR